MSEGKKSKTIAKIGNVPIELAGGKLRVRFYSTSSRRISRTIGTDSKENRQLAKAIAADIDSRLTKAKLNLEKFDDNLGWLSGRTQPQPVEPSPKTLHSQWEQYKSSKVLSVSKYRQKVSWSMVDKVLSHISNQNRDSEYFKEIAKSLYSGESLKMIQTDINAALKGSDIDLIRFDLSKKKDLSKSRSKQAYSEKELRAILDAFEGNYYYPYACFLSYTGCRPSEAIALTWDDILWDESYILINKAFVGGELKNTTKTNRDRRFPINPQLDTLLKNQCSSEHRLLFPSPTGGYLNQHNFSNRTWKLITEKLFDGKIISKRLPPYSLRNSWITLMLKKGLDIATVAKLAGTSEKMIMNNYWGADDNVVIPTI